MQTKMDVCITLIPKVKVNELRKKLAPYKTSVLNLGDKIYIATKIDVREDTIEQILGICEEYGTTSVEAHLTKRPLS